MAGREDAPGQMFYGEFDPAPECRHLVACYWQFRVPEGCLPTLHTVPPDGGLSLGYSSRLRVFGVVGPRVTPFQPQVFGGEQFWGVRLWPGAIRALFHVAASTVRDLGGPWMGQFEIPGIAGIASGLRECRTPMEAGVVLDQGLLPLVRKAGALDDLVMDAVFAVLAAGGNLQVSDLVERSSLSDRQFRRRFREAVGLTPKEMMRVQRARASMIGAMESAGDAWVTLACAHGYADQAHLSHEYRRLIGLSPEQMRAYLQRIEHGPYRR